MDLKRYTLGVLVGVVGLLLVACDGSSVGSTSGRALRAIDEPRVTVHPTISQADGRVKNVASRPYGGVIKVTLFDEAGKIVGVLNGAVNNVQPGEEATYTAIGTDRPEKWARIEVRIDTELPG